MGGPQPGLIGCTRLVGQYRQWAVLNARSGFQTPVRLGVTRQADARDPANEQGQEGGDEGDGVG